MKMRKYKVSDECIGCRACVEVAGSNFEINDKNHAYLKKQPENEIEAVLCEQALDICPVNAITVNDAKHENTKKAVLAASKIKATLDKYPELKDVLINLSPRFKKMQNPALFNTLARFANFNDAAKMTGLSVCEILHTINKHLGTEEELLKNMPDCIKEVKSAYEIRSVDVTWHESSDKYIYNNQTFEEIITLVSKLSPQHNAVIISRERPDELLKVAEGLEFIFNVKKEREYRVSIFNPAKETKNIPWMNRKDTFDTLEVRSMMSDPFDIIIKKAYETEEDDGFILIQRFEPLPLINMLSEMGFEHLTEQRKSDEFRIYFHKKVSEIRSAEPSSSKVDAVIQSATPAAYPVIMRLLQSEKIRKHINIKELKVWEETEKHLAWIANGKADISFSALITSAKLINSDIKIPALFVWDNFVLLTRYEADNLEDIIGKRIHTPLFEEAPPAKITKYLIKASGLNTDDFEFVFGKPFGRPEEIYKDFVTGKADTVILREPEASYAIKIMRDRNEDISIISYNEIWNQINPGFGSFPNAGLVLKGEFAREHPEETRVLLEELKSAIEWVNNNKTASAELSFDMMRQPVDRIELFLNRVNFDFVEGIPLIKKVKEYFEILNRHEIVDLKIDDAFLDIFRMP